MIWPIASSGSVPAQSGSAGAPAPATSSTGAATSSDASPPRSPSSSSGSNRRVPRSWLYTIVAIIVIVVVVVVGVSVIDHNTSGGTSTTVLVAKGTLYGLPAGQFNSEVVNPTSTATVTGSIVNLNGVYVYTMTPAQEQSLARTGTVSGGYLWTSGYLANDVHYNISLTFQPGSWDIVFLNPSDTNETWLGFTSNLSYQEG